MVKELARKRLEQIKAGGGALQEGEEYAEGLEALGTR
jgi:hypothetical protein